VYESWISTLHKYPWFAHECVIMIERRLLYDATMALSKTLIILLRKAQGHPQVDISKPTPVTLQELTVAMLTCPGFSEMQKAAYIQQLTNGGYGQLADSRGMNLKFGGVGLLAPHWPFMAVVRDPAAQEDLVLVSLPHPDLYPYYTNSHHSTSPASCAKRPRAPSRSPSSTATACGLPAAALWGPSGPSAASTAMPRRW